MCSRTQRPPSSCRRSLSLITWDAIEREIKHAKRDGAMELAEAIRGTIYQITGYTMTSSDQPTATPRMITEAQNAREDALL